MAAIKNGSTFARSFVLYLAGTKTPATGKTPAAQLSKAGGTLVSLSGAIVENVGGAGWYTATYNSTDTNTNGSLGLHVTAAGCDPYDSPDADQVFAGTLLTSGTGTDQLQVSGGGAFLNASEPVRLGLVPVTALVNDGAPTASGFITNMTNADDDHWINYNLEFITGALGGQVRQIASYNHTTKAVTLVRPFTRAPANGDSFNLVSAPDVGAVTGMARLLGLTAENVVEDDVVMDPNGSGFRISWTYYLYDTAAHATAHVTGGGGGTGLLYKYAVLREIASGLVKRATVTRTL